MTTNNWVCWSYGNVMWLEIAQGTRAEMETQASRLCELAGDDPDEPGTFVATPAGITPEQWEDQQ